MVTSKVASLFNATAISLSEIPLLDPYEFRHEIASRIQQGSRLSALFGTSQTSDQTRLFALLCDPREGCLSVCSTMVGNRYPALSSSIPQAFQFECQLVQQRALVPEGDFDLQAIDSSESSSRVGPATCVNDRHRVLAIGPIFGRRAEPARYRFECRDEIVQHVEIEFGGQNCGIEQSLLGGPDKRSLHLIETCISDTTVGQTTAYCETLEALTGTAVPMRAQIIRGIALELERVANHTGDLGALAEAVSFLPTASFCGRLKNEFLDATAAICGSRFGHSLVRPGGVGFDLESARINEIYERITKALADVEGAVQLLWKSGSVQSRFEGCGILPFESVRVLGIVGPPARACGAEMDVRHDVPSGIYRYHQIPVSTVHSGDVFARAFVRWLEIQRSIAFIQDQLEFLKRLKSQVLRTPIGDLRPDALAVSLVEGWRGEICHMALTNDRGRFASYRIYDPSFHNWSGLIKSLQNQQLSDFTLIRDSFHLSGSGPQRKLTTLAGAGQQIHANIHADR